MVPGGQLIYIDRLGAVSYTQAHSGGVPKGTLTSDWYNRTSMPEDNIANWGPGVPVVDWIAPSPIAQERVRGIIFCPLSPSTGTKITPIHRVHQLYANTLTFNRTDCLLAEGIVQRGNSAALEHGNTLSSRVYGPLAPYTEHILEGERERLRNLPKLRHRDDDAHCVVV